MVYLLVLSDAQKGVAFTGKVASIVVCGAILMSGMFFDSWEDGGRMGVAAKNRVQRLSRDYAATSVAGKENGRKFLEVNGSSMTSLSTDTKFMAHLPMALHKGFPHSVLVICFGMGTSFRSALSWGGDVTVVELLPSVKDCFTYFHVNARDALSNPRGHIIIDDGRRFLKRTSESFDLVIVDPPPPPEAAASSLLYSTGFFEDIKKHLKPDGVLMEWYGYPGCEREMLQAVARSIVREFPFITIYRALDEPFMEGYFFLCSEKPIETVSSKAFLARLPESAKQDLMEWSSGPDREQIMKKQILEILSKKLSVNDFLVQDKSIVITDDHPFNEYYFLRRYFNRSMYINPLVQ